MSAFLDEPMPADVLAWWDEQFADDHGDAGRARRRTRRPGTGRRRRRRPGSGTGGSRLETAVNRWDAQMTTGVAEPIEAKLASDGVSEVLDTFLPGGHRAVTTRPSGLVALQATDVDHTWHVRLRGDGVALLDTDTLLDDDELRTRAVAVGPASDLMLALHGRIGIDVLDVTRRRTTDTGRPRRLIGRPTDFRRSQRVTPVTPKGRHACVFRVCSGVCPLLFD